MLYVVVFAQNPMPFPPNEQPGEFFQLARSDRLILD
jgi:hypothetical protein